MVALEDGPVRVVTGGQAEGGRCRTWTSRVKLEPQSRWGDSSGPKRSVSAGTGGTAAEAGHPTLGLGGTPGLVPLVTNC